MNAIVPKLIFDLTPTGGSADGQMVAINELEGNQLDWVVAHVRGYNPAPELYYGNQSGIYSERLHIVRLMNFSSTPVECLRAEIYDRLRDYEGVNATHVMIPSAITNPTSESKRLHRLRSAKWDQIGVGIIILAAVFGIILGLFVK